MLEVSSSKRTAVIVNLCSLINFKHDIIEVLIVYIKNEIIASDAKFSMFFTNFGPIK